MSGSKNGNHVNIPGLLAVLLTKPNRSQLWSLSFKFAWTWEKNLQIPLNI